MPLPPTNLGNCYMEIGTPENVYTIPLVTITSYSSTPVYAEDGYTMIREEIKVSGTGVLNNSLQTFNELKQLLNATPGRVSTVEITTITTEGTDVPFVAFGSDAMNGPLFECTITELVGQRAAMITFTATTYKTYKEQSPESPIVAHRWTSSFQLDAAGRVTRTTTGTLTVDLSTQSVLTNEDTSTDNTDIAGKRPWADLFRRAILPLYPGGDTLWRRESQTFAYNDAGNQLIYTIVDRQAKTNLPDGALSGTCDFSYERTLANMAFATMRFSCDLEGSIETNNRSLINAAVVLATSRIPLNNYKTVRIDRIYVNEQEMLDRAKIRFEITVIVPATGTDPGAGTYNTVPLANVIGRHFTVTRTCLWYPDAYGSQNRGMMAEPHWYLNTLSAKNFASFTETPAAQGIAVLNAPNTCVPGTPTIVMVGDDASMTAANESLIHGPFAGLAQVSFNQDIQPISVEKAQTTTNVKTDTRMHRLQTLYTNGSDFVFQAGKASVVLEEVTTVKQTNTPPSRVFRPIPAGFVVAKDDWRVNFGDVDMAGNRTFIGVYTRTLISYDGGGTTSNGYSTVSGRRQWWPPSATVTSPLALGFSQTGDFQDSTKTVLDTTTNQSYSLGAAQNYA